jgi:hypothetical protein
MMKVLLSVAMILQEKFTGMEVEILDSGNRFLCVNLDIEKIPSPEALEYLIQQGSLPNTCSGRCGDFNLPFFNNIIPLFTTTICRALPRHHCFFH